jgi:hypothetical protein
LVIEKNFTTGMEYFFNCFAEEKQVGRSHTTIIILSHPENEEMKLVRKGLHQLRADGGFILAFSE